MNNMIKVLFEEKDLYVDITTSNIYSFTPEQGLAFFGRWNVPERVPMYCPYISPHPSVGYPQQNDIYSSILSWKNRTEITGTGPMDIDDDPLGLAQSDLPVPPTAAAAAGGGGGGEDDSDDERDDEPPTTTSSYSAALGAGNSSLKQTTLSTYFKSVSGNSDD